MKRLAIFIILMLPVLQTSKICGSADQSISDQIPKVVDNDESSLEIENVHEVSFDNIDIDGSGNWLEKRIWYEKAQAAFDDVRTLANKVVDMRVQFSNEVNIVGHKIDAFYESVDFDAGQIDYKLKDLLIALDVEQKLKGDLSEKEKNLQVSIKQEQLSIAQLISNMKSIGAVDDKIEQTLRQAFKTIDECRGYESKAWTVFKSIGKEIDDKKARNLCYEINNLKQNIDQKSNYLTSSLLPYLHNILVAKIESTIATINDSMAQLKQKGVDLEAIMKSEQADDFLQIKEREKQESALALEKSLQDEQDKQAQENKRKRIADKKQLEQTWSYKIYAYYNAVASVFTGIAAYFSELSVIKYIGSFFAMQWKIVRDFMHSSVENLMIYFKSGAKKEAKQFKNNEVAQVPAASIVPTVVPAVPVAAQSDALVSVAALQAVAPVVTQAVADVASPVAEQPTPATTLPSTPVTVSAGAPDDTVTVQYLKQSHDNKELNFHLVELLKAAATSLYQGIESIFGLNK